jgi:hypothetical protein
MIDVDLVLLYSNTRFTSMVPVAGAALALILVTASEVVAGYVSST